MRNLYRATPLALQLEQVFKERTEPKLPTIMNKNLTVLPWDWELPSTILTSEWASKHTQCFGAASKIISTVGSNRIEKEFCAMGLLLHYFGWTGDPEDNSDEPMKHVNNIFASQQFNIFMNKPGPTIVHLNDNLGENFHGIGRSIDLMFKI